MPIFIIAIVIILLSALAGYALVTQSIEKHRAQKQRALMILKTKHRNFVHLIDSFPKHFLSNDLMVMAYQAIVETCEQLHTLDPNNSQYPAEIIEFNTLISHLGETNVAQKISIENPQQLKEIRQNLQELNEFVTQQEVLELISGVQAEVYRDQIKYIEVQMTVDESLNQAKLAEAGGKLRLAAHYFSLAKKQFISENANNTFDKQIAQIDAAINNIETELANAPATPESAAAREAADREWEIFNTKDEWQKKQNYY